MLWQLVTCRLFLAWFRSLADLRAAGGEHDDESRATSSFAGGERSAIAIQNRSDDFPHAA